MAPRVLELCIAAGLACAGAFSTGAAKADLIWGANGHPISAYSGVPIAQQLDLLKDLGMKSYRVDVSSTLGAGKLGELISEGKKRDIAILPVLTPALDLANASSKVLYSQAFNFAAGIISRFQADVKVWELGNEMETFAIIQPCEMKDDGTQYNCAWGPAGGVGALDYFGPRWAKVSAVLKGLSDGASSVDPSILKAVGTAGWGRVGAFELMKRDGINWDISVWHMYGDDPEWAFKALAAYNKPIWVTEFNAAFGSRDGEAKQADALRQSMRRLRDLAKAYNVEAAHVYELLDETYWAPSFEAVMGLLRLQKDEAGAWKAGDPKPAYNAVKETIGAP